MSHVGNTSTTKGSAIDTHAHFVPPGLLSELERHKEKYGIRLEKGEGGIRLVSEGHKSLPIMADLLGVPERLELMKKTNIEIELASLFIDIVKYDLPMDESVNYSTLVNECFSELISTSRESIRALATLPLPHGDEAARVLRDAVDAGLPGAMIGTNVLGTNLDADFMEPVWKEAVRLNVPIVLHPLNVAGQDRLGSYYLRNLLGNPLDTSIAAASIELGGVFERNPGLKVLLPHGGGFLPYGYGRITHGHICRPETHSVLKRLDRHWNRHFYYDTVIFEDETLDFLIRSSGADRVMLGTDTPFDMGAVDAKSFIESRAREDTESILHANAEEVFNL